MVREETIKQCLERGRDGRGIIIINQNAKLSEMHYKKALRNIEVMNYLKKGNYEEWTVITAYYSMYQACLSILTRIGLQSKDHTCTVAIIEKYFVRTGKLDKKSMDHYKNLSDVLEKIEKVKIEQKLLDALKDIRDRRENIQYDVETRVSVNVENVIKNSIEFVENAKILVDNLDTKFIEAVRKDLERLA
ncbi:MAG: hypothetical protein KJ697_04640 [Nanoarchaeota archaeon]|nr:hypothetical protein [Nanoarchaeota archaeon]MBU4124266.1 hypothetical protein [Nanoarchaeota archaeon]